MRRLAGYTVHEVYGILKSRTGLSGSHSLASETSNVQVLNIESPEPHSINRLASCLSLDKLFNFLGLTASCRTYIMKVTTLSSFMELLGGFFTVLSGKCLAYRKLRL